MFLSSQVRFTARQVGRDPRRGEQSASAGIAEKRLHSYSKSGIGSGLCLHASLSLPFGTGRKRSRP
jgi:hypothetical protein